MSKPQLKILCVCSGGFTRSVALKRAIIANWNNVELIAVGADFNSHETLNLLSKWADLIFAADESCHHKFCEQTQTNAVIVPIGPDIYSGPDSSELCNLIRGLVLPIVEEHIRQLTEH